MPDKNKIPVKGATNIYTEGKAKPSISPKEKFRLKALLMKKKRQIVKKMKAASKQSPNLSPDDNRKVAKKTRQHNVVAKKLGRESLHISGNQRTPEENLTSLKKRLTQYYQHNFSSPIDSPKGKAWLAGEVKKATARSATNRIGIGRRGLPKK